MHLLRIGEFAALGRVSIKAVRFYEREGLLTPDYVDPDTRYRYFRVDQYPRLAMITNLRAAGFPISEIAALINADPDTETVVDHVTARRERLIRERADIDERLAVVESLLKATASDSDDPLSAVKLTSMPAQLVHSVSATVPSLGQPVTNMFESAESHVASADARAASAPFMIFHDPPSRKADLSVEVCIPIEERSADAIENKIIDACERSCSIIYSGDYAQTEALGASMIDWAASAGLEVTGPLREIYHRFGADQSDYQLPPSVIASRRDEFITELLLPVAAKPVQETNR